MDIEQEDQLPAERVADETVSLPNGHASGQVDKLISNSSLEAIRKQLSTAGLTDEVRKIIVFNGPHRSIPCQWSNLVTHGLFA